MAGLLLSSLQPSVQLCLSQEEVGGGDTAVGTLLEVPGGRSRRGGRVRGKDEGRVKGGKGEEG